MWSNDSVTWIIVSFNFIAFPCLEYFYSTQKFFHFPLKICIWREKKVLQKNWYAIKH